jgi:pimeloyl-ACP methyl ester carboxylesterase
MADHLAEHISASKKLIYEGVAHMINLEEPDRLNSDLVGFLRDVSK